MGGEFLELRIPITENTTKKIVALAALTGKSLPDIKETLAADLIDEEAFDMFVSQQLHGALAELDGVEEAPAEEEYAATYTVGFPKVRKTFASAEQESNSLFEDIAGHSLSGDEDTGAPSLEEQYQQEEFKLRTSAPQQPVDELYVPPQQFPDVGSNVDAFIDMDDEEPAPVQARLSATSASVGSVRKKKGASISEYTGDDDGPLF